MFSLAIAAVAVFASWIQRPRHAWRSSRGTSWAVRYLVWLTVPTSSELDAHLDRRQRAASVSILVLAAVFGVVGVAELAGLIGEPAGIWLFLPTPWIVSAPAVGAVLARWGHRATGDSGAPSTQGRPRALGDHLPLALRLAPLATTLAFTVGVGVLWLVDGRTPLTSVGVVVGVLVCLTVALEVLGRAMVTWTGSTGSASPSDRYWRDALLTDDLKAVWESSTSGMLMTATFASLFLMSSVGTSLWPLVLPFVLLVAVAILGHRSGEAAGAYFRHRLWPGLGRHEVVAVGRAA